MKKLFVVVFFFLSLFNLSYSQYVSPEEARKVAENVFNELFESKSYQLSEIPVIYGEKSKAELYIFNAEKTGFVIISGDKRVFPLLAYSKKGRIQNDTNNWSPSFKAWLEMYAEQISLIKSGNAPKQTDLDEKWEGFLSGDKLHLKNTKDVAPMLTTNWNQGCGYNSLCPEDSGPCGHVYTGCVATAMAQVMRYMEHPAKGTGSQCYNTAAYGELCVDFSQANYDYSAMPNNSGNEEVAELMYHCGVAVYMNYSPSGSGAYSHNVVNAWEDFFGYTNHLRIRKNNYEENDWLRIIRNEIDNGRPIYYAGFNSSSGHAFVFDGYQGSDFFHINWGWGGSYNGYFYLNDLTPGGSSFTNNQEAIIGTISADDFTGLDVSSAQDLTCGLIQSGDISSGTNYVNYYKNTYPAAVGKELVYKFTTELPGRIRVKITNNIGGDVNVFLLSHPHEDSLVTYGKNGFIIDNTQAADYYLVAEGDKGKEPVFDIEVICPSEDADLIYTGAEVSPGFTEPLMSNLTATSYLKNIGNSDTDSCSVQYYLSDDDILDGSDVLIGGDSIPGLAPGESTKVTSSLTVPEGPVPGDYQIIFVADLENVVVESDDDNFAYAYIRIPDEGLLDCSSAASLQDGVWYEGNTAEDGSSNVDQYWSASDMTGPELTHSFIPLYDGFVKVSYIEKNPGNLHAMILPICNENTYLTNIWFSNVTDTAGYTEFYATAGTEYFIVVDGENGVSGEYALKVDLPGECPKVELQLSGDTALCDGEPFPSLWTSWGANSYQWFKDGEEIMGENGSYYSVSSVGVYYLELTENNCKAASESINVEMSFPPDTAQITSSGALVFCPGSSVELQLANTVKYPINWALNDELIPGADSESYTATQAGEYSLFSFNGSCSLPSKNTIHAETKNAPAGIGEQVPVPSDKLEFYYPFDEDNNDYSGNQNNFSCWDFEPVDDRFGNFWQARYFTSDDVFGYSQTSDTIPDEFSLSLWFKSGSSQGGLIAGFVNNPWGADRWESLLYISDNGKLHFYISNDGTPAELVSTNTYNDNNWHLVTIVYDGSPKMSINKGSEFLENTEPLAKETFKGYWVFAGSDFPTDVSDMPTSSYFNGSLDNIILLSEANEYIDSYNFLLPELGINLLSDSENCSAGNLNLEVLNAQLHSEYRVWNETKSEWFSETLSGNYEDIILSGLSEFSETTEFKVSARDTLTSCEVFLDTSLIVSVYENTKIITQPVGGDVCEASDFTTAVEVKGEKLSYQWKKGADNVGEDSSVFLISEAQLSDAGDYYCEISGFCGELTSSVFKVNVLEQPAALAGSYEDVCGNSLQLDAADPSPFSGTWTLLSGSASFENNTAYNTAVSTAAYGEHVFRWTVSNDLCIDYEDVVIEFLRQPVADFDFEQNGLEISFINTSVNADSFFWDFGDDTGTSNIENPTYTYSESSNYTIELTVYNASCEDDISKDIPVTLGLNDASVNTLRMYPNPTADFVSFDLTRFHEKYSVQTIELTDYSGRTIRKESFGEGLFPKKIIQIDLSSQPAGIYFLKINYQSGSIIKKLVKQ
jgi:PKD repeat protein